VRRRVPGSKTAHNYTGERKKGGKKADRVAKAEVEKRRGSEGATF
jgi:hypothetical protein